jgi:hypothetical protein
MEGRHHRTDYAEFHRKPRSFTSRGAVVTTLPFAMVDTLLLSLELESVRRSTVEFTKLITRRFRRQLTSGDRRASRRKSTRHATQIGNFAFPSLRVGPARERR